MGDTCDAYEAVVGAYDLAPPGIQPRRRLAGSLKTMRDKSNNGGRDQNPTASRFSIAHSVCHDCDDHEKIHTAKRPEDAKQAAIKAAINHGRATGHEVDEELVDEPIRSITIGPDVADTEVVGR